MRNDRGLTLVDVVVGVTILGLGFAFLALPTIVPRRHERSESMKCSNNLKQIAMAAIQYADDKRFFPHLAKVRQLDGGYDTTTSPRVLRGLVNMNYLDNPETFICPSAMDQSIPLAPEARADVRCWRWNGAIGPATKPNLYDTDPNDPTLRNTTELSYGWTRRGLSTGSCSSRALIADRGLMVGPVDHGPAPAFEGNHHDFFNVAFVDGHVRRMKTGDDEVAKGLLTDTTTPEGLALGIDDSGAR